MVYEARLGLRDIMWMFYSRSILIYLSPRGFSTETIKAPPPQLRKVALPFRQKQHPQATERNQHDGKCRRSCDRTNQVLKGMDDAWSE